MSVLSTLIKGQMPGIQMAEGNFGKAMDIAAVQYVSIALLEAWRIKISHPPVCSIAHDVTHVHDVHS